MLPVSNDVLGRTVELLHFNINLQLNLLGVLGGLRRRLEGGKKKSHTLVTSVSWRLGVL